MTNFEYIKNMNAKEFAEWHHDNDSYCEHCIYCPSDDGLCGGGITGDCYDGIAKWLESEVKE